MHIPDSALSPQTYAPAYAAMIPVWAMASARLKKTLRARRTPMLALGAAFSFVIMMFNIPVPGGSSGHAVGAVLIAILLGPWAAVVAVSLTLAVQALLFGDGGILTLAANCLNMAVLMPFAGWGVYRLVAGSADSASRRHWVGGALGGYVGLNAAALGTAVMLGIQPQIAHDAAGRALYCPIGLKVAVPAMAVGHLLVFGFVEALVTGMVVAYFQRTDPALIAGKPITSSQSSLLPRVALSILGLVVISPLGLILPAKFVSSTAWGEWSESEVRKLVGYVPRGFRQGASWHAILPDYARPGTESTSLVSQSLWYVISAALGIAVIAFVVMGVRKIVGAVSRRRLDVENRVRENPPTTDCARVAGTASSRRKEPDETSA